MSNVVGLLTLGIDVLHGVKGEDASWRKALFRYFRRVYEYLNSNAATWVWAIIRFHVSRLIDQLSFSSSLHYSVIRLQVGYRIPEISKWTVILRRRQLSPPDSQRRTNKYLHRYARGVIPRRYRDRNQQHHQPSVASGPKMVIAVIRMSQLPQTNSLGHQSRKRTPSRWASRMETLIPCVREAWPSFENGLLW